MHKSKIKMGAIIIIILIALAATTTLLIRSVGPQEQVLDYSATLEHIYQVDKAAIVWRLHVADAGLNEPFITTVTDIHKPVQYIVLVVVHQDSIEGFLLENDGSKFALIDKRGLKPADALRMVAEFEVWSYKQMREYYQPQQ